MPTGYDLAHTGRRIAVDTAEYETQYGMSWEVNYTQRASWSYGWHEPSSSNQNEYIWSWSNFAVSGGQNSRMLLWFECDIPDYDSDYHSTSIPSGWTQVNANDGSTAYITVYDGWAGWWETNRTLYDLSYEEGGGTEYQQSCSKAAAVVPTVARKTSHPVSVAAAVVASAARLTRHTVGASASASATSSQVKNPSGTVYHQTCSVTGGAVFHARGV
jgi:hypothetical protein